MTFHEYHKTYRTPAKCYKHAPVRQLSKAERDEQSRLVAEDIRLIHASHAGQK